LEPDDLLLLAMDPTCQDQEEESPGLENEIHGRLDDETKTPTMSPSLPMVNDWRRLNYRFCSSRKPLSRWWLRFGGLF